MNKKSKVDLGLIVGFSAVTVFLIIVVFINNLYEVSELGELISSMQNVPDRLYEIKEGLWIKNIIFTSVFLLFFISFSRYVYRKIKYNILQLEQKQDKLIKNLHYLNELSQRLEMAVNGTKNGLWDWDLLTDEFYISPQWKEQLGYSDNELKNELQTWQNKIYKDDKENVKENYRKNIEINAGESESIYRLIHKNGNLLWVLEHAKIIFDENGKAIRIVGLLTDITKMKEQEIKIKKLTILLHTIINSIDALVFVKDKNFKYLECNKAFEDVIGHTRDEILGKDDYELFTKEQADLFREYDVNVLQSAQSKRVLKQSIDADGNNIYRFVTLSPLFDDDKNIFGVAGSAVDITEIKNLELKLRESKNMFDLFMDNLPYVVVIKDENCIVRYKNLITNKYIDKGIIGRNATDNLGKELGNKINALSTKAQKEGKAESVIEYTYKDKKYIFRVLAFAIPQENTKNYIGMIYMDITKEKQLSDEIEEQKELMIAQSRHAAMGEMISMIAHQWRQPISVIAMDANNILVDIELDSLETKSLKNDVENIVEQTQHLSKTIDDFRNFFKPNKTKDEVFIGDVFDETLDVIGTSLKNNNIEVQNNFNSQTKVKIFSRELLQVFLNILKNAKEELIEHKESDRKIINTIEENEQDIIVEIRDNGNGIPNEIIEKIFDPYFSTKDEKNGTGLGLYISKVIVQRHLFGSIMAKNYDDGAAFILRIPKNNKEIQNE